LSTRKKAGRRPPRPSPRAFDARGAFALPGFTANADSVIHPAPTIEFAAEPRLPLWCAEESTVNGDDMNCAGSMFRLRLVAKINPFSFN